MYLMEFDVKGGLVVGEVDGHMKMSGDILVRVL